MHDGVPHVSPLIVANTNLKFTIINDLSECESLPTLWKYVTKIYHSRLREVIIVRNHTPENISVFVVWDF